MDALKAEIAAKRKALQDDPIYAARPTKYMRRGDIEKFKEEQEAKAREQKETAAREKAAVKVCLSAILPTA
jgi:pre-mRNA-splicing factor 18